MYIKAFNTPDQQHPSYLIGCERTGDALVIDPTSDIAQYLRAARRAHLTINHIAQTRLDTDYLSGTWALAHATDAPVYLSDRAGFDDAPTHIDDPVVIAVRDSDTWLVGELRVRVLETFDAEPDHTALLVTDTRDADRPLGVFSGSLMVR
jgi:hydroxyacylglutathione hydrolase